MRQLRIIACMMVVWCLSLPVHAADPIDFEDFLFHEFEVDMVNDLPQSFNQLGGRFTCEMAFDRCRGGVQPIGDNFYGLTGDDFKCENQRQLLKLNNIVSCTQDEIYYDEDDEEDKCANPLEDLVSVEIPVAIRGTGNSVDVGTPAPSCNSAGSCGQAIEAEVSCGTACTPLPQFSASNLPLYMAKSAGQGLGGGWDSNGGSEIFTVTVNVCVNMHCPYCKQNKIPNSDGSISPDAPEFCKTDTVCYGISSADRWRADGQCKLCACTRADDFMQVANLDFAGGTADDSSCGSVEAGMSQEEYEQCIEDADGNQGAIDACDEEMSGGNPDDGSVGQCYEDAGGGAACGCDACEFLAMKDTAGEVQSLIVDPRYMGGFECIKMENGLDGIAAGEAGDTDGSMICPLDYIGGENVDVMEGINLEVPELEQSMDELRVCAADSESLDFGMDGGVMSIFDRDAVNLRWSTEEPNILARLPVQYESAGFGYKHHDLVFQSQVRDIGPPYMEPSIPFPIGLLAASEEDYPEDLATQLFGDTFSSAHQSSLRQFAAKLESINTNWKNAQPDTPVEDVEETSLKAYDARGVDYDSMIHDYAVQSQYVRRFNQALRAASQAFADPEAAKAQGVSPGYNHPRAQDAIVGPRGCDIGGWYEMMLYQARCIKWFGLNCMCDYEKTFIEGSAEAYVLNRAGMTFNTVTPVVKDGTPGDYLNKRYLTDPYDELPEITLEELLPNPDADTYSISLNTLTWPLEWRGPAGPSFGLWRLDDVTDPSEEIEWGASPGLLLDDLASYTEADQKLYGYLYGVLYKAHRMFIEYDGRSLREGGPRLWDPYNCQISMGTDCDSEPALGSEPEEGRNPMDPNDPGYYYIHRGYKGLDHAAPGDFVIYDETLLSKDSGGTFHDAGYRRHIAYVESIGYDISGCSEAAQTRGDCPVISVTVSEWNWGKNLDSCGSTDRWRVQTKRTIYKDRANPEAAGDPNHLLTQFGPCDDPDNAQCWEPNWERIKLYRPAFDVTPQESGMDTQYAQCEPYICLSSGDEDAEQVPCSIAAEDDGITHIACDTNCAPTTGSSVIPHAISTDRVMVDYMKKAGESLEGDLAEYWLSNDFTLVEWYDFGLWRKPYADSGRFDGNEVQAFLKENVGSCEPPVLMRKNVERLVDTERRYKCVRYEDSRALTGHQGVCTGGGDEETDNDMYTTANQLRSEIQDIRGE